MEKEEDVKQTSLGPERDESDREETIRRELVCTEVASSKRSLYMHAQNTHKRAKHMVSKQALIIGGRRCP